MMRPSEIRVWSLIWPRRASLGNVRYVSMASVRADLLAATIASAAVRARLNASSVAAAVVCATREAERDAAFGCARRAAAPSG